MKRKLTALVVCAVAALGVAAPAQAALTRRQAAYQDITRTCLSKPGCGSISEWYPVQYYGVNNSCAQYRFQYHTSAGWYFVTTGSYCAPPYAR